LYSARAEQLKFVYLNTQLVQHIKKSRMMSDGRLSKMRIKFEINGFWVVSANQRPAVCACAWCVFVGSMCSVESPSSLQRDNVVTLLHGCEVRTLRTLFLAWSLWTL